MKTPFRSTWAACAKSSPLSSTIRINKYLFIFYDFLLQNYIYKKDGVILFLSKWENLYFKRKKHYFCKNILRKFSNKYVIATLVFVAVIVFIDQYNVFEQGKSIRKLRKMKKQEENYNYEIKKQEDTIEMLYKDSLLMEKVAREKYMMKRDNEVIYVLEQR